MSLWKAWIQLLSLNYWLIIMDFLCKNLISLDFLESNIFWR